MLTSLQALLECDKPRWRSGWVGPYHFEDFEDWDFDTAYSEDFDAWYYDLPQQYTLPGLKAHRSDMSYAKQTSRYFKRWAGKRVVQRAWHKAHRQYDKALCREELCLEHEAPTPHD